MASPLLLDGEITAAEMVLLGQLSNHPGYAVLERLIRASVDRANAKVVQLSPEHPNYGRVLAAFQQEARAQNAFAHSVLKTVASYSKQAVIANGEEDLLAVVKNLLQESQEL